MRSSFYNESKILLHPNDVTILFLDDVIAFDDVNPGAIVTFYLPNLPLYHCFRMMSPSWGIVYSSSRSPPVSLFLAYDVIVFDDVIL